MKQKISGNNLKFLLKIHLQTPFILILFIILIIDNSLAQPIKMVPQTGHSSSIYSVIFSEDGKYLASQGGGGPIIWYTKNWQQIIQLQEPKPSYVSSISFSPDNAYFVTGVGDGRIIIWNTKNWQAVKNLKNYTNELSSAFFTKDGQYLISVGKNHPADRDEYYYDNKIIIRNTKTWKIINRLPCYNKSTTSFRITCSCDGNYIASVCSNQLILIREIKTGKQIKMLGLPDKSYAMSIRFSDDGRYFVSGNWDNKIIIWDVKTWRIIKQLEGDQFNGDISLAFSHDGKYLASSSNKAILIRDTKTWKIINRYKDSIIGDLKSLEFSKINENLALINNGIITVLNIKTGQPIIKLQNKIVEIMYVLFSRDNKYLYSVNKSGSITAWETLTWHKTKWLQGTALADFPISVALSPNGDYLATQTNSFNLEVRDTKTWQIVTSLWKERSVWNKIKGFTPDNKYLVVYDDPDLLLWNTEKKIWTSTKELFGIKTLDKSKFPPSTWEGEFAFPDNWKYLAYVESKSATNYLRSSEPAYSKIMIWDTIAHKAITELKNNDVKLMKFDFSGNGKYFAAGYVDSSIIIWDTLTWTTVSKLKGPDCWLGFLTLSQDGKYLASRNADNTIILWDTQSGKQLNRLIGQPSGITSATFSPDGKYLVSSSYDGTLKIFNILANTSITLVSTKDDWLVYTDDGYFDSSRNGGKLVDMVKENIPYSIDQMAIKNNRPDIILKRMGCTNNELLDHYYNQYHKRLRKSGFIEEQLATEINIPNVEIKNLVKKDKFAVVSFNLKDEKFNLKKYNIYINDVPIYSGFGKEITGKNLTLSQKIELSTGLNKIEVSCINEKGVESYRALIYEDYNKPIKGNLYYLGFGISKYKDASLNLQYADKDAKDLANLFSKMTNEFNKVYIKTWLNEEMTVFNVIKAKEIFTNAKVDDTVVLFIAGHGVHDTDKEATYYYLSYDADLNNLSQTAANFELIENILQGIAPRKKLFLMDTCESGEIDDSVQNQYYAMADTRGIKPRAIRGGVKVKLNKEQPKNKRTYLREQDRFIYNDLNRRTGAIVFSACKGGEFSYESPEIENGFFTKEIINCLMGETNKNGFISTEDLRTYVIQAVAKRSSDLQHPTVDRDNIYQKFGFPVVK